MLRPTIQPTSLNALSLHHICHITEVSVASCNPLCQIAGPGSVTAVSRVASRHLLQQDECGVPGCNLCVSDGAGGNACRSCAGSLILMRGNTCGEESCSFVRDQSGVPPETSAVHGQASLACWQSFQQHWHEQQQKPGILLCIATASKANRSGVYGITQFLLTSLPIVACWVFCEHRCVVPDAVITAYAMS